MGSIYLIYNKTAWYIGKTANSVRQRYQQHMASAKRGDMQSDLKTLLNSIHCFETLETHIKDTDLAQREKHYLQLYWNKPGRVNRAMPLKMRSTQKKGAPVHFDGVRYSSIKEAYRKSDLPVSYETFQRRIKKGATNSQDLLESVRLPVDNQGIEVKGVVYDSLKDVHNQLLSNYSYGHVQRAYKQGRLLDFIDKWWDPRTKRINRKAWIIDGVTFDNQKTAYAYFPIQDLLTVSEFGTLTRWGYIDDWLKQHLYCDQFKG